MSDARSLDVERPPRRSIAVRRLGYVLVAFCVLAAAWLERDAILRLAATLWIVSDPVAPSDAAVVLGGGLDVRPFAAAELYRKGLVKRVLVSQVDEERVVSLGIVQSHTELNRQVLLRLGVPADAISTFGAANSSTADEAATLSRWARDNQVTSFIIPIEVFSTRRVRFIFEREMPKLAFRVDAVEPPQYSRTDWWRSTPGLIAFQNEVVKYIYYRIRY
jgi:hypothetical protein